MAVTGTELVSRARSYADENDSDFITDAECLYWVNVALGELFDMLVLEFEDYLVGDPVELSTDSNQYLDLPSDFYKMRKVFYKESNWRYPVHPFNMDTLGETNVLDLQYSRYRIMGDKLWFENQPTGGKTIEIWYIPKFDELTSLVEPLTFALPNRGWEEYVVFSLAARMVLKNEADASSWVALRDLTMERIKSAAAQRDIGEPHVARRYRSNRRGQWRRF